MTIFFSPSIGGFVSEDTHGPRMVELFQTEEQIAAGEAPVTVPNPSCRIPDDAIEVTEDQWEQLLAQQGQGKIIRAVDGLVVAVDPPGPRPDEQLLLIRAERNKQLRGTDSIVAVPDFAISEQRREELIQWRAALRALPETLDPDAPFESVAWPPRPEWLSEDFRIVE